MGATVKKKQRKMLGDFSDYFTPKEAARELVLSESTVRVLLFLKRIKPTIKGGRKYIHISEIERYNTERAKHKAT